jgi:lysosomal alpha-glucosidase
MSIEQDGNAMGLFFLNSNAMDVNVQPRPALTFITIGGIVDFFLYTGPNPHSVVSQHTEIVGRSQFPQYFTLGFHLCRWKYETSERLKEIIQRNRKARIPYDVQWTDIDAMSSRLDWTYDLTRFVDLPAIVQDLHANDQYYINIIDPGINNKPGYYPYESGLAQDIFIKYATKNEPLIGVVWPGLTLFPDYTHPNATKWWSDLASRYHQIIPFDGLWIDMNEPSSFIDGSVEGCHAAASTLDNPPYTPKVRNNRLDSITICPSSRQHLSNHYNLHNMYGHFEARATNQALRSIFANKRPFVLTRSSFSGTGQWAAHWSGDNRATWEDLYYSIPNMLNFNFYGISQVGSDICGFNGETNEELCIRWMQLGSFYPFMRNHNNDVSRDQDPGAFSLEAQDFMRKTLKIRYTLLPYLYTLFYRSSVFGETVVRPLFFEFVEENQTHHIDKQFMFGGAFLVTPVLDERAVEVSGYFPNETWYKYDTGEEVNNAKSSVVTLQAPLSDINIHLRAGCIVPVQFPSLTTKQSRKNPFGLLVGLKKGSNATGTLFWDDGESVDSIESKRFNYFNFTANNSSLVINRVHSGYATNMILSDVKIYGLKRKPMGVSIDQQPYDNFVYDEVYSV